MIVNGGSALGGDKKSWYTDSLVLCVSCTLDPLLQIPQHHSAQAPTDNIVPKPMQWLDYLLCAVWGKSTFSSGEVVAISHASAVRPLRGVLKP